MQQQEERKLSPEELRRRENQKEYLRSKGVLIKASSKEAPLPVEGIVMSPKNPLLSVFREFWAGIITLDDLEELIDVSLCSDERKLLPYHFHQMPSKPAVLEAAENEFRQKHKPEDWEEGIEKIHNRLEKKNEEVHKYLYAIRRKDTDNLSNRWWLRDRLKRQEGKNPIYAARLRVALNSHEVN